MAFAGSTIRTSKSRFEKCVYSLPLENSLYDVSIRDTTSKYSGIVLINLLFLNPIMLFFHLLFLPQPTLLSIAFGTGNPRYFNAIQKITTICVSSNKKSGGRPLSK